jgi:hypothetical protein
MITLATPPPAIAFSQEPIYVEVSTDQINSAPPYFDILVVGTGPTAGQQFTLVWLTNSVQFTFVTTNTASPLDIEVKGAMGIDVYADYIAAALREQETVSNAFLITREANVSTSRVIRLTYRSVEPITASATENCTNITITPNNITGAYLQANLRALIEVWATGANLSADSRLSRLHAPYDVSDTDAIVDISPAFAGLVPHLPPTTSIAPTTPAFTSEVVTKSAQKYHLRTADKYGQPPTAEALIRSGDYLAILGGRSADTLTPGTVTRLLHNYLRRDKAEFRKPVDATQPDWVYWLANTTGEAVKISILVYWSDGTTSTFFPFTANSLTPVQDTPYLFASGYRQSKLYQAPITGPTAAGSYIVAYDWRLEQTDAPGTYWLTVRYGVDSLTYAWSPMYLLVSNGVGGMETVRLFGKQTMGADNVGETYETVRWPGSTDAREAGQPTKRRLATSSVPRWEANTGLYDSDFYLQHLRQLPLSDAWLCDIENKRFLRVIVEPKSLDGITQSDRDLHQLSFTIRAAWTDQNATY